MKLPRDLSGAKLARHLRRRWGYHPVHQRGSHLTLETLSPTKHRVVVPQHPALKVGTLADILDAVARHKGVSREEVLKSD